MTERFFMGDCDCMGHSPSATRAHALLDECLSLLSALQQPSHPESDEEAEKDRNGRIELQFELIKKSRKLYYGIVGDYI